MPNPKRRHSKSRTGMRRAHDALVAPTIQLCPECKAPRLPHRACPGCGYYISAPTQTKRRNYSRQIFKPEE
ncbi:MAG: 50S ribosomal protein L32 [Acidobacteriota bacterium]|nr:50S ribosomal protein L32 [Blastocatellia bacterium]MDW8412968.1 50S ribosomal protein L32 [Acidobacteriota bacterium]